MIPATPAKRKGGHVKTRVIVRLKPRVLTTLIDIEVSEKAWCRVVREGIAYVGKKELNEQALRWKFCMKQKSHVLLSLHACFNPSTMLAFSCGSPTRSRSMRACANSRSCGVSQLVVRGVLGRSQKPNRATTPVTAPSLKKSVSVGSHRKSENNLQNEEPSPSRQSARSIHTSEHSGRDESL